MKIRHERPSSDLAFRVRAPLGLILATGDRVSVEEWSLEGLAFPGDSDVLPTQAILAIPFQGVDIQFPVRLVPEAEGRFLRFEGLTGRQRETLSVFFRSILSGRMASTEEVITSLDTPVDLVPIEETEEERAVATVGKSPRLVRAVFNVAVFALIAAVVAVTLGQGIWRSVSSVRVETARIEATLETRLAPQGAFVSEILVAEGEGVAAGQRLVALSTPETEAAMADVRGRIAALEAHLEEAGQRAALLEERIAAARALLPQSDVVALAEFDARLSTPHLPLFEAHAATLREIAMTQDTLRRLRRERGRVGDARDAMHVIAPADGVVREIAALESQFLSRGAEVLTLEHSVARQARGWVDQGMAGALFVGMEVAVAVNLDGTRQVLRGEVAALEAGIDPTLSPEFGMLVTVGFPGMDLAETQATLPHAMPVELRLMRPWAARLETRGLGLMGAGG